MVYVVCVVVIWMRVKGAAGPLHNANSIHFGSILSILKEVIGREPGYLNGACSRAGRSTNQVGVVLVFGCGLPLEAWLVGIAANQN